MKLKLKMTRGRQVGTTAGRATDIDVVNRIFLPGK
jgi:hypothetical protein